MQNGGDQVSGPGWIGVLIFWIGLGAFFPLVAWGRWLAGGAPDAFMRLDPSE